MFQEPVRRMANRFDHFASLQVKDVTVLHVAHDNAASCPRNSSDRPHVAAILGPLISIDPPIDNCIEFWNLLEYLYQPIFVKVKVVDIGDTPATFAILPVHANK